MMKNNNCVTKNIDAKLEEILIKHGIVKAVTLDAAIEAVRELEKNYLAGKKLALYGCGNEADNLCRFIYKYAPAIKIAHCLDKNVSNYQYNGMIINTAVVPIEELEKTDVDCIILCSYIYRKEFQKQLETKEYRGDIFDIYEYLEDYIGEHFSNYKIIFEIRQKYNNADRKNQPHFQRELIKQYILIKDFMSAFGLIDEYCRRQYPNHEKYGQLKEDLEKLFSDIKNFINNRKTKDILINWVDSLSYYELEEFPFLEKQALGGGIF